MPDILDILFLWWKKIIITMIVTTLLVAVVLLMVPREYVSVATALPANSVTADKARIFNRNIEALYPEVGTSDELDKIIGTAQLDTIYLTVAQQFRLADHYIIHGTKNDTYEAAQKLKRQTRVLKSEYGELKIKVWDQDSHMAAALANALLQSLQQIHQHIQGESNQAVLQRLKEAYEQLQQQYEQTVGKLASAAGAQTDILTTQKTAQLEQLQQYSQLIAEYGLARQTNSPVLLTVEQARPAFYYDRPKRTQWLLLTFFASGLFAFLTALFLESRKHHIA